MEILAGIIALIGLTLLARKHFRDSVKPFQVVGAKIDDKVYNVSIIKVNKELRIVTIKDSTTNKVLDISLDNIFIPTSWE